MQFTFNQGSFKRRRPNRFVATLQDSPTLAARENSVDRTSGVLESRESVGGVVASTGRHR